MCFSRLQPVSSAYKITVCSPPNGPDCGDADRWWLAVVEAADGGLEELLDELRRHGGCESTGRPQRSPEEERRRRWSRENKKQEAVEKDE